MVGGTFGRLSGLFWTVLGCSTFWEAFWTALDWFWALWATGLQRAAELQSCRAAGLQGCRAAELQGCRAAGLQGYSTVCAHSYCIPALTHAELSILKHIKHFCLCLFLLYSGHTVLEHSLFCMYVLGMDGWMGGWMAAGLQHCLCAFLLYSGTDSRGIKLI